MSNISSRITIYDGIQHYAESVTWIPEKTIENQLIEMFRITNMIALDIITQKELNPATLEFYLHVNILTNPDVVTTFYRFAHILITVRSKMF